MTQPVQIFALAQSSEIKFKGAENSCYIKLQAMQSQSADWAMKNGGWTVEPYICSKEEAQDILKQDNFHKIEVVLLEDVLPHRTSVKCLVNGVEKRAGIRAMSPSNGALAGQTVLVMHGYITEKL